MTNPGNDDSIRISGGYPSSRRISSLPMLEVEDSSPMSTNLTPYAPEGESDFGVMTDTCLAGWTDTVTTPLRRCTLLSNVAFFTLALLHVTSTCCWIDTPLPVQGIRYLRH